jgi:hypothetical protein
MAATAPNSAMAAIRRLVAIGRRMNPSEMFMVKVHYGELCVWRRLRNG